MITVKDADAAVLGVALKEAEPEIDKLLLKYDGIAIYWCSNGIGPRTVEFIAEAYRKGGWIADVLKHAGRYHKGRGPWIRFSAKSHGSKPAKSHR